MVKKPNLAALRALLESEPLRGHSDNRKPVRKAMDDNEVIFRGLAEKGHPHEAVVDAFLADFPDIRKTRTDLDDAAYRKHVRDTYASFKKKIGVKRAKSEKTRKAPKPKTAKVETAAPVEKKAAPAKALEPTKPSVVKPTTKGFQVPKAKDF